MAMELRAFADEGLTPEEYGRLAGEHDGGAALRYERLWSYYRNEVRLPGSGAGDHGSAQEVGLPARFRSSRVVSDGGERPEVVIENDIAWRVDALVDFVFGKPVRIVSTAGDAATRAAVDVVLDHVWERSGGAGLFQDMAVLGGVHGFVDLLVRGEDLLQTDEGVASGSRARVSRGGAVAVTDAVLDAAERVRVELVAAPRALPVLDGKDYRRLRAYAIRTPIADGEAHAVAGAGRSGAREGVSATVSRWLSRGGGHAGVLGRHECVEVLSAAWRELYEDGELVWSGPSALGELPVVHIQNTSQPYVYEGLSDVEPMIPLQDELNTRLSDRAYRVTMQSFRTLLAKGIEGFSDTPVRPGQVWSTMNEAASVESFGGDAHAPSESEHIQQVRDALDKVSGVSPVVLGLLRARIGHLSSENALRVTLMGVLAKTARKRRAYGRGIERASRLILSALDRAGVLPSSSRDRGVRLIWPDPLPVDERRELQSAERKVDLGIPSDVVISELGYAADDAGVA